MRYYVLDAQGNKFGPADVSLLNAWAAQGRIAPHTVLVEESTGRQLPAAHLPGLMLPNPTGGYTGSPFGASAFGPAGDGSNESTVSMWLSVGGLVGCFLCPMLGVLPAIAAIFYANIAVKKGGGKGQGAMILAIFSILANVLAIVGASRMYAGLTGGG